MAASWAPQGVNSGGEHNRGLSIVQNPIDTQDCIHKPRIRIIYILSFFRPYPMPCPKESKAANSYISMRQYVRFQTLENTLFSAHYSF